MAVFTLKYRDTRPILEAVLYNPDGTVHEPPDGGTFKLHIKDNGTVITRDMVKVGVGVAATLQYSWVATDWTGTPALPAPPSIYPVRELPMEYEVVSGTSRMTFPNGGYGTSYDTLQITSDIA